MITQNAAGFFILLGILPLFGNRLPFISHLPGDFSWQVTENVTIFLPIGTCLLASIIFAVIMRLFFSR